MTTILLALLTAQALAAPVGTPAASPAPPSAAPVATPAAPTCPADRLVTVDLERWKADLVAAAARSPKEADAVLARLGLAPVSTVESGMPCESGGFALEGVDSFSALLSGGREPDRVLQARFVLCPDEYQGKAFAQRILVLRPEGAGRWCRVGDELSHDQPAWDEPCLGEKTDLPRTFAFVHLTDAVRQSIRVRDQGGSCDGVSRGADVWLGFWEVRGGRLVEVFRAQTYHTMYDSPTPPTSETTGRVTLRGGFPKRIVVTEEVSCAEPFEDDPTPPEPCTPSKTTTTWTFTGARYED